MEPYFPLDFALACLSPGTRQDLLVLSRRLVVDEAEHGPIVLHPDPLLRGLQRMLKVVGDLFGGRALTWADVLVQDGAPAVPPDIQPTYEDLTAVRETCRELFDNVDRLSPHGQKNVVGSAMALARRAHWRRARGAGETR